MNHDTRIRVRNKWIEITNHRALVPNVQGETGLIFTPEVIRQSVEDYTKLIETAPYYRMMLDSHVKLSESKWADIAGMITDVWTDTDGAARLNYVVFNNTPVYDRIINMGEIGGLGFISLSTRGHGRHVRFNPSRTFQRNKVRHIKMLHDSPIRYFKVLGEKKYKKGGVMLDDFILLGWDIVVMPSQNNASSYIFVDQSRDTGMVREASSIIRKSFGDTHILKDKLVSDLQVCTGTQCYEPVTEAAASLSFEVSPVVPHLRSFLVDSGFEGELYERFGSNVIDMLNRWT